MKIKTKAFFFCLKSHLLHPTHWHTGTLMAYIFSMIYLTHSLESWERAIPLILIGLLFRFYFFSEEWPNLSPLTIQFAYTPTSFVDSVCYSLLIWYAHVKLGFLIVFFFFFVFWFINFLLLIVIAILYWFWFYLKGLRNINIYSIMP